MKLYTAQQGSCQAPQSYARARVQQRRYSNRRLQRGDCVAGCKQLFLYCSCRKHNNKYNTPSSLQLSTHQTSSIPKQEILMRVWDKKKVIHCKMEQNYATLGICFLDIHPSDKQSHSLPLNPMIKVAHATRVFFKSIFKSFLHFEKNATLFLKCSQNVMCFKVINRFIQEFA